MALANAKAPPERGFMRVIIGRYPRLMFGDLTVTIAPTDIGPRPDEHLRSEYGFPE